MIRGSNTNNSLQELELILSEMGNSNFDFDGIIPESAQSDVREDIEELMQERKANCLECYKQKQGCFMNKK